MTGGATRGQAGEIITKIESEINDWRERGKGITTLHHSEWTGSCTERERGDKKGQEMRGTGDVKQRQKRPKKEKCVLKGSKDSKRGRKSLPEGMKTSKSKHG